MNSLPLCIIVILLNGVSAQIGYDPEPDHPASTTSPASSTPTPNSTGISTSDASKSSSSSSSSPLSSIGGIGGLAAIIAVTVAILLITCLLCRRRHKRVLEIESSHASSRPRHIASKTMATNNVVETYPLPIYQDHMSKEGSVRIDM